jgi:hypothetical protein
MLERRHFLGATLGSVLIPGPAAAQTQAAKPGGSGQLGLGNVPLPATSAADRLNELGPENAAMAAYAGLWDVTETVWDKPGGNPVTTTGLVAERRMIGSYLQEFIRPASDTSNQDIKRIDYLSFQRMEGRWKYVSIEMRAPVGIMPAYSFDRGDAAGVVLVHDAFAITGGGVRRGRADAAHEYGRHTRRPGPRRQEPAFHTVRRRWHGLACAPLCLCTKGLRLAHRDRL